jgi:hypothetical protein
LHKKGGVLAQSGHYFMPIIYDNEGKNPFVIDITLGNESASPSEMVKETIEKIYKNGQISDFAQKK